MTEGLGKKIILLYTRSNETAVKIGSMNDWLDLIEIEIHKNPLCTKIIRMCLTKDSYLCMRSWMNGQIASPMYSNIYRQEAMKL